MRRKNGNVLIIMIFLLIITSIFGVIITRYVKDMLSFSDNFISYYNAYYQANAGLELQLTKVNNRGFGFEDKVSLASTTVSRNFTGDKSFSGSIKSKTKIIKDDRNGIFEGNNSCKDDNKNYVLEQGGGVIIPLFSDNPNSGEGKITGLNYNNISQRDFSTISIYNFGDNSTANIIVGVVDESLNVSSKRYTIPNQDNGFKPRIDYNPSPSEKSYLIIANSKPEIQKICIESGVPLSSDFVSVRSVGKYRETVVGLEASKIQNLPEYLIYSVIEGN